MPSTTERQAHFMAAIAHGWQPPGRHVPISVGKEFHNADKKVGKWEHATTAVTGNKQSSDHMNGYS
jgi:hypothetical protein